LLDNRPQRHNQARQDRVHFRRHWLKAIFKALIPNTARAGGTEPRHAPNKHWKQPWSRALRKLVHS